MANLGKSVKGKSRVKKLAKQDATASKAKSAEDADLAARMAALNRKLLKASLSREMEMTKANKLKVQNAWLKIMRLAKVDELRRDVEIVSQAHERDVDRKDAILQMLDRDLDEAEEQYQLALRQHLRSIDHLVELQDERLQTMEHEFESDLDKLTAEFKTEKAAIEAQHSKERHELSVLVTTVETEESDKANDTKHDYETLKEETRSKHVERVNLLSASLDQQIEDLQRAFEAAHLNYLHQTDSNTEEFKNLTRLDKAAAKSIDVKLRLINKTQRSLDEWKAKVAATEREYTEKNTLLETEKTVMGDHARRLKGVMQGDRRASEKRLVALSKAVADTTSALKEKADTAERILVAMERCRMLETEAEKVAPFADAAKHVGGDGVAAADEKAGTWGKPLGATAMAGAGADVGESKESEGVVPPGLRDRLPEGALRDTVDGEEMSALANFHKKYNKVLLDKLTLEREKARLEEENTRYQTVLKQYLEGVSVNATAVDVDNTLLMVNGRTSKLGGGEVPVRHAAPAVVEANHMAATGRVAGGRAGPL